MKLEANPIGEEETSLTDQVREDALDVEKVLQVFGKRSFVVAMALFALLALSPLGYIPLFAPYCGLLIIAFGFQMLSQRSHIWLPDFISKRHIHHDWIKKGLDAIWKGFEWCEKSAPPRRGRWIMRDPFIALPMVGCIFSGVLMIVFAFVPLAPAILAFAVLWFCAAFAMNDGGFVVVGLVLMGFASIVPLF